MILYDLQCACGKGFEAWFKDSAAYDAQSLAGDIECPFCGGASVKKAPMAPRLSSGGTADRDEEESQRRFNEILEQHQKGFALLQKHLEENYDNVGNEFAAEARRIHYGETKERGIYGETSEQEAKELHDEGVDFFRLPVKRYDS